MRKNSRGGYYLPAISKRLSCLLLSLSMLAAFAPIMASAETGTKYGDYLYYEVNEEGTAVTITDCDTTATEIEIPSKINGLPVTIIGDRAFENCQNLINVAIPNSVTQICWCAFRSCNNLTSITIPNSVMNIGDLAFSHCIKLINIKIPDNIYIGYHAFYNTAYYNDIGNWENNVLYIENYLIDTSKNLSGEYTIKNGTNLIADKAFENCENLVNINIPNSVTYIGAFAFNGCIKLKSITIPEGVTYIGQEAFGNCDDLTYINIANSLTSIGICAFLFNGYSDNPDNWENNALYIGNYLMSGKKINGEYAIKSETRLIAGAAFNGCKNLKCIIIPDSIIDIGEDAFWSCTNLSDVYYSGTEEQWKNVNIRDGNKPLTNATIHYNSKPTPDKPDKPTPSPMPDNPDIADTTPDTYDIDEITATETGISFSVTTKEAVSGRQVVMVACYDENGVFTDLKQQEIAASDTAQDIDVAIDKTNSKTVKAFIWNAIGQMMPASRAQSLELQQN